MLNVSRRAWVLIGVAAALGAAFVFLHILPGLGSGHSLDEPPDVSPSSGPSTPGMEAVAGGPQGEPTGAGGARASSVDYARARQIARQSKPENLQTLRELAGNRDWKVRHAAVVGIGRLGRKGDPGFLVKVLRDPAEVPEVRAAAAEWLGDMKCWEAGPALIDAMDDPDSAVRACAAAAMRRLMGVDSRFRFDAPVEERRRCIRKIRNAWPAFYENRPASER